MKNGLNNSCVAGLYLAFFRVEAHRFGQATNRHCLEVVKNDKHTTDKGARSLTWKMPMRVAHSRQKSTKLQNETDDFGLIPFLCGFSDR